MSFILNAWYVAAWSHEVADKPLARTLLGQPVVLYRGADGQAHALLDRCPHRGAPLSLGRVEGNDLRCMYHGLKFNAGGQCLEIPNQARVPPQMCVASYPVVEKDRFLWIWMGDATQADAAGVPDIPWQSDPAWAWKPDYVHYRAGYQLIVDNLLDLSHLSFVHLATLGSPETAKSTPAIEPVEGGVRITRWDLACEPTPLHRLAGMSGLVDRWLIFNWFPPARFLLDAGSCPAGTGAPEGRRVGGIQFRNTSLQTPETETTTHYFWTHARDFDTGDAALTDRIHAQMAAAFEEDRVIIEAQQQRWSQAPDARFLGIAADAGPLRARRLIEQARAKETVVAAATPEAVGN